MWYGSALLLGLLGSLHCVGMCGPIALALPRPRHQTALEWIGGRVFYQAGRVASYATLGLLFGLLGSTLQTLAYQKALSFAAGGLVLLWGLYHIPALRRRLRLPSFAPATGLLTRRLGRMMQRPRPLTFLGIGVLNGFLPCGLAYLAAGTSISAGAPAASALYMLYFGLGTVPAMLAISLSGWKIKATWRNRIASWLPYAAVALALLMVLRGMELGIPYLSPSFEVLSNGNVGADCH
jgi:hypothetical protein